MIDDEVESSEGVPLVAINMASFQYLWLFALLKAEILWWKAFHCFVYSTMSSSSTSSMSSSNTEKAHRHEERVRSSTSVSSNSDDVGGKI